MFFATRNNIPDGLGFNTFDFTHIMWLAAILVFWVTSVVFYCKSDTKQRNIIRITLGVAIVLLEILKDIFMLAIGELSVGHLPLHLCGINILLIAFDIFKETKVVNNFLYYFCIPGALLAILFPNWTALPCLNFSHIHSFVIHALLVLYPILLVAEGKIEPKFKNMLTSIMLLILMAIPIYFVNLLCDTNFMFLMEPETGNPLGLFEQYLGSHLWGFPILLPIVMVIMYIPLWFITKKENRE